MGHRPVGLVLEITLEQANESTRHLNSPRTVCHSQNHHLQVFSDVCVGKVAENSGRWSLEVSGFLPKTSLKIKLLI